MAEISSEVFIEVASSEPVIARKAKVSSAPRNVGKDKTFGYEYRNLTAVADDLKKGELIFDVKSYYPKNKKGVIATDPKFKLSAQYSDRAPGDIYVGLKTNDCEATEEWGKKYLKKDLVALPDELRKTNPAAYERKLAEVERKQDVETLFTFLRPVVTESVKQCYDGYAITVVAPQVIRMTLPKDTTKDVFKTSVDSTGVEHVEKEKVEIEFDVLQYLRAPGKPRFKLGAPFLNIDKPNMSITVYIPLTFMKTKYLTDAEKAIEAEKEVRLKMAIEKKELADFKKSNKRPRTASKASPSAPEPDAVEDLEEEPDEDEGIEDIPEDEEEA